MHLHHPSLSLSGKRKGKFKYASADAKRKAEQLNNDWQELQKKWGVETESRKRNRAMQAEPLSYSLSTPPGRTTAHIPSRGDGVGVATARPQQKYTGTKMLGIGVLHKSNSVPIFSDQEAKDISTMRRG